MQRADSVAPSPQALEESDFPTRKFKVAAAIIVGTLFRSTILPMMALCLLLLPMTGEFGWSRTGFSLGMSAMMLGGRRYEPALLAMVGMMAATINRDRSDLR